MALVFTRSKKHPAFYVGDSKIIVEQRGNNIRVIVDAPDNILVLREELVKNDESSHGETKELGPLS